jgi:hypothetical protein
MSHTVGALLRFGLQRTLPSASPALPVVLGCAAGAVVFAAGLDLLGRT